MRGWVHTARLQQVPTAGSAAGIGAELRLDRPRLPAEGGSGGLSQGGTEGVQQGLPQPLPHLAPRLPSFPRDRLPFPSLSSSEGGAVGRGTSESMALLTFLTSQGLCHLLRMMKAIIPASTWALEDSTELENRELSP